MRKETKYLEKPSPHREKRCQIWKSLLPTEKRDEKFGKTSSPLRKETKNLEKLPPQ
jgi:hypothetical protein